jgi:hypothetical protein
VTSDAAKVTSDAAKIDGPPEGDGLGVAGGPIFLFRFESELTCWKFKT